MRNREYFDTYAGGGIVGGSKMDFAIRTKKQTEIKQYGQERYTRFKRRWKHVYFRTVPSF